MSEYPELLQDLLDKLTELFTNKDIPEETAKAVAMDAVFFIRREWGGLNLYIPQGHAMDIYERNMEICRRFSGKNHAQLAREYGLSVQGIYRIVKEGRENERGEL